MKSKYIISILLFVIGLSVMGQTSTVYTPWGTAVNVWTQEDQIPYFRYLSDQNHSTYLNYGANFLPNLYGDQNYPYPSSSSTFNCHGYAWYMFWRGENEFDAPWNMNLEEAEEYFNDPSYVECSEAEADILWINNGAHSALTTNDEDILLSKWATGPLATHGKGILQSPWPTSSANTTYYKKCTETYSSILYIDDTWNVCAIKIETSGIYSYVDLEIEYEEAVLIEGPFTTGTGATLYIHPD